MQIILSSQAYEYLEHWKRSGSQSILDKINRLTLAIIENPYQGLGKQEALKYNLAPKWSRRITKEHRFVYIFEKNTLFIYSLKGHYL